MPWEAEEEGVLAVGAACLGHSCGREGLWSAFRLRPAFSGHVWNKPDGAPLRGRGNHREKRWSKLVREELWGTEGGLNSVDCLLHLRAASPWMGDSHPPPPLVRPLCYLVIMNLAFKNLLVMTAWIGRISCTFLSFRCILAKS